MRIKFVAKLDIKDEEILNKSKEVLFKSMIKMKEIAMLKVPIDMGMLLHSIELTPDLKGFNEYTLIAHAPYASDVEYGTSPHFVPILPLKGWAGRVLGDQSLAWAVQKKIAMVGTNSQPFFRPAFDEVRYVWMPRFFSEE